MSRNSQHVVPGVPSFAKIRVGAHVGNDMAFWRWPRLAIRADKDTVFEVFKKGHGLWTCCTRGFGALGVGAEAYGAGPISVSTRTDLLFCEFVPTF